MTELQFLAGRPVPLGIDWLEVAGHSLPGGGGARIAPHGGYAYRLRSALEARGLHDYAIGGAIACRPNAVATGDGGYPWVLRNLPRPGMPAHPSAAGAPYNPQSQLALVHFGLNDMGVLGAAKPLPWQAALRTILARFCASSVFMYDHAAIAYTGTWSTIGISDAAASSTDAKGVKYSTVVGDKLVFSVPADFPAGRVIDVCLWINSGWAPSTIGVKVDGASLPDLVITPANLCDQSVTNQHIVHTLRLGTGQQGDPYGATLGAGAHTIELTVKAGAGLALDSFAVEADPLDGPLLICPLPNKPANYSVWSGWTGGASMTDAAIDQWKDYERAILAEFPSRVISDSHGLGIDLDDAALIRAIDGTGDFVSDGAHPNERGHGKWLEHVARIVRSSPLITDRVRSRPTVDPRPRAWKKVGAINGAGAFLTGWSNFANASLPDMQWRVDDRRRVSLRGTLKAAATATTSILANAALPKPAQLSGQVGNQFDGVSTWSNRGIRVSNGGALTLGGAVLSGAGNLLEFDFDYQAEL